MYVLQSIKSSCLIANGTACQQVTTFNNGSYATDTTGPAFYVTWNYTAQPSRNQPVHAFPNIMIKQDPLPVLLKDVKAVELDVEWSYAVGNNPESTTNEAALTADALDGNVAVDMFLDSDKETSSNSSSAAFEIMVWFAQFGASTDPLGYTSGAGNGKVLTRNVNGTDLFVTLSVSFCQVLTSIFAVTCGMARTIKNST